MQDLGLLLNLHPLSPHLPVVLGVGRAWGEDVSRAEEEIGLMCWGDAAGSASQKGCFPSHVSCKPDTGSVSSLLPLYFSCFCKALRSWVLTWGSCQSLVIPPPWRRFHEHPDLRGADRALTRDAPHGRLHLSHSGHPHGPGCYMNVAPSACAHQWSPRGTLLGYLFGIQKRVSLEWGTLPNGSTPGPPCPGSGHECVD